MKWPCRKCEYDLRSTTEPRCPECGFAFDPSKRPPPPKPPPPPRTPAQLRSLLHFAFVTACGATLVVFALTYVISYQNELAKLNSALLDITYQPSPKREAFTRAGILAIACGAPCFLIVLVLLKRFAPRTDN